MVDKTKWVLDKSLSELAFSIKRMMITDIKGVFLDYDAEITTIDNDFETAGIDLIIKVSSVYSNDKNRDKHLKSHDFFDVENFNDIKFKSKSLKQKANNFYELSGDLIMKNISNPIILEAEFNGISKDDLGNIKAGFTLEGKINRRDWGLSWNALAELGIVFVAYEVNIHCKAELLKSE
jgi:polyisoprenoid-binding protein YceI